MVILLHVFSTQRDAEVNAEGRRGIGCIWWKSLS